MSKQVLRRLLSDRPSGSKIVPYPKSLPVSSGWFHLERPPSRESLSLNGEYRKGLVSVQDIPTPRGIIRIRIHRYHRVGAETVNIVHEMGTYYIYVYSRGLGDPSAESEPFESGELLSDELLEPETREMPHETLRDLIGNPRFSDDCPCEPRTTEVDPKDVKVLQTMVLNRNASRNSLLGGDISIAIQEDWAHIRREIKDPDDAVAVWLTCAGFHYHCECSFEARICARVRAAFSPDRSKAPFPAKAILDALEGAVERQTARGIVDRLIQTGRPLVDILEEEAVPPSTRSHLEIDGEYAWVVSPECPHSIEYWIRFLSDDPPDVPGRPRAVEFKMRPRAIGVSIEEALRSEAQFAHDLYTTCIEIRDKGPPGTFILGTGSAEQFHIDMSLGMTVHAARRDGWTCGDGISFFCIPADAPSSLPFCDELGDSMLDRDLAGFYCSVHRATSHVEKNDKRHPSYLLFRVTPEVMKTCEWLEPRSIYAETSEAQPPLIPFLPLPDDTPDIGFVESEEMITHHVTKQLIRLPVPCPPPRREHLLAYTIAWIEQIAQAAGWSPEFQNVVILQSGVWRPDPNCHLQRACIVGRAPHKFRIKARNRPREVAEGLQNPKTGGARTPWMPRVEEDANGLKIEEKADRSHEYRSHEYVIHSQDRLMDLARTCHLENCFITVSTPSTPKAPLCGPPASPSCRPQHGRIDDENGTLTDRFVMHPDAGHGGYPPACKNERCRYVDHPDCTFL